MGVVIVLVFVALMLVALFALLRYERFAHRDPRPSGSMTQEDGTEIPIRHGALDESLFTGIRLGVRDDLRRLRKRFGWDA